MPTGSQKVSTSKAVCRGIGLRTRLPRELVSYAIKLRSSAADKGLFFISSATTAASITEHGDYRNGSPYAFRRTVRASS